MWIEPDICYKALATRDSRFDGRFFVAVSSTGIYCRPVCPTRVPKRPNCQFYASAAAAEVAGYRPCLRCRPELAPGHASVDANQRLAGAAAGLIEDGLLTEGGVAELSDRLGVTDRHLRRVFTAEFGVSPIAYAQTQRLLLAKRLLTDTRLPVTDVAMAAGFGSLRRFNTLFRERYRLQPNALRKLAGTVQSDELVFELAYRPPYAWDIQLEFLARRAISGVEAVTENRYLRTVAIPRDDGLHHGWLTVSPSPRRATLQVTLSGSLAAVVPEVLGRVKRLFDLSSRPDEIARHLGELAAPVPGLRVPGAFEGFEMAVRAVLGQQITVQAACTLAGRVAEAFGTVLDTPFDGLRHSFPDTRRIVGVEAEALGLLGITRTRVRAIQALARACDDGSLVLAPQSDVTQTLASLQAVPGIGAWTAHYIAMRALAWPDAFLQADYGVLKALNEKSPKQALQRAEQWRPWRAYAVLYLWHSLAEQQSASPVSKEAT